MRTTNYSCWYAEKCRLIVLIINHAREDDIAHLSQYEMKEDMQLGDGRNSCLILCKDLHS